jgi:DNA invertase Pin-like site-specific DNA recombinase
VKLACYLRVSTNGQAEDGAGLEVQERGCHKWATAHAHQIVATFTDAGVSGANGIESRIGLGDALHALENRTAGGLVVYRLDRLARSLTTQEGTLAKVWALGAAAFSVGLGEIPRDDPSDPMRTALRQMVGVFAQLERGLITARLRAGRQAKRDAGGFAGGPTAYGYRVVDGVLEPCPEEQAVIARIREWRARDWSYRTIVDRLEAEGIPARRGRWHPDSIRRIALRPEPQAIGENK